MTGPGARVLVVVSAALPLAALLLTARMTGSPTEPATALPAVPVAAPLAGAASAPSSTAVRGVASSRSAARTVQADPAWTVATARRTGIPRAAVAAYGRTALMLALAEPACHLGWTTLAGIGAVESAHGTIGSRRLGADGRPSTPILGPALDGRLFAAVPSTADSSRWHGDPRWDHAIGPMQFIPSTWRRWSADGDGDGLRDPNDLDDAALAAGRYLCASGRDLTTGSGWDAAVRSYNHSDAYIEAVRQAALGYQ